MSPKSYKNIHVIKHANNIFMKLDQVETGVYKVRFFFHTFNTLCRCLTMDIPLGTQVTLWAFGLFPSLK